METLELHVGAFTNLNHITMNLHPANEPAFPSTDLQTCHFHGMTRRQLIAKDLLAAMYANEITNQHRSERIKMAVETADDLIEYLDKTCPKNPEPVGPEICELCGNGPCVCDKPF